MGKYQLNVKQNQSISGITSAKQTASLDTSIWTIIGISLVSAALIAILVAPGDYKNGGTLGLKENQLFMISGDLINAIGAEMINNGQVHYRGNISNYGIIDCNGCASGVNYIDDPIDNPQAILGDENLIWYDGVLDNMGGLLLYRELKLVNSWTFTDGIVTTNRAQTGEFLHFLDDAVYINSSNVRHVDGYIGKTGDDAFTFPVGDGSAIRPVGIRGNNPTDFFKAAYFSTDPNVATLPVGGPFSTLSFDAGTLSFVNDAEYWDVQGVTTTPITLSWDASTNLSSWVQGIDTLAIAGWEGSEWVYLGNAATTGNLTEGTITSQSVIPDNYSVFTLAKASPSTFPVEWLGFEVVPNGEDARLSWETALELNSSHFEVQRSLDMQKFVGIGEVAASGNSSEVKSYEFTDEKALLRQEAVVYYRLKQVDLDGKSNFSEVVSLRLETDKSEIQLTVFPNPSVDYVNVWIDASLTDYQELRVLSAEGRVVHRELKKGNAQYEIPVFKWANGTYQVVVTNSSDAIFKPLIIQR